MFHGTGQVLMVMIVYSMASMINYLPIMLITGVVCGMLTAYLGSVVLSKMNKIMI